MNLNVFLTLATRFKAEADLFTRDAEIASWKLTVLRDKSPEIYSALVAEATFLGINVPMIAVTGEAGAATLTETWNILLFVAENAGLGIEEFLSIT